MDEQTWLTTIDARAMLAARHPARSHGSADPQTRRPRMYLLACARRAWGRLPAVCRALVALAETYADAPDQLEPLRAAVAPVAEGLLHCDGAEGDLRALFSELMQLTDRVHEALAGATPAARANALDWDRGPPAEPFAPADWRGLAALVYLPFDTHTPTFAWVSRRFHSARLVREVYGNPYRPAPFDESWRSTDAVGVARRIHEARDFGAMPVLADALQEAGCDCDETLAHCRDLSQCHARGCWVLDRVIGLK